MSRVTTVKRHVEFMRGFPAEVRVEEDSEKKGIGILAGKAIMFNAETIVAEHFREIVRAGSCTKTLQEGDPLMLWDHQSGKPMGRKSAGTLEINEDDIGVAFVNYVPDTSWGRDALVSVRRGDVKGMSFGFWVVKERWTEEPDVLPLRELLELQLMEISAVAFPQYKTTQLEARSIMEANGITPPPATTEEPGQAAHSEAGADDAWRVSLRLKKLHLKSKE